MKEFEITIIGETASDVILALEEIYRLVEQGYSSGSNGNDEGEFNFSSTGEWGEDDDIPVKLEKNEFRKATTMFPIPGGGVKFTTDTSIGTFRHFYGADECMLQQYVEHYYPKYETKMKERTNGND